MKAIILFGLLGLDATDLFFEFGNEFFGVGTEGGLGNRVLRAVRGFAADGR